MHSLDTDAARMDALADAIRSLVPVLVDVRRRHGPHVTELALEAALAECKLAVQRQRRTQPALALVPDRAARADTQAGNARDRME